ncbi:hypothetical protein [Clavibacter sp. VKM Ac-2873]|uniref:hypothetical protein n=1 Tax=Clavibacter sp. VKM Ac-2873 TaxID=2783813 RepID=UPI001E62BD86|nr:hypothetical protein [Clavibacter sp. VKM Ac-2873]
MRAAATTSTAATASAAHGQVLRPRRAGAVAEAVVRATGAEAALVAGRGGAKRPAADEVRGAGSEASRAAPVGGSIGSPAGGSARAPVGGAIG